MSHEPEFVYICYPTEPRPAALAIEFLPVGEFVADEPACRLLWELISSQFRTRGKFLAVWSGVRYVAVHRDDAGDVDGFLLVILPSTGRSTTSSSGRTRAAAGSPARLVGDTRSSVSAQRAARLADKQAGPAAALRILRVPGRRPEARPRRDRRVTRLPNPNPDR